MTEQTELDPARRYQSDAARWDGHYQDGVHWRPLVGEEADLLDKHFAGGHGLRALDIACGTGDYAKALHGLGYAVTGVDFAPTAIAVARAAHPGLQFLELDIEEGNLARLDADYDLITCRLAYAFMRDKPAFLARVHHLLAPGGTFYVTTPVAARLPDHRRYIGITDADATELCAAGWGDVSVHDIDTIACYVLTRLELGR